MGRIAGWQYFVWDNLVSHPNICTSQGREVTRYKSFKHLPLDRRVTSSFRPQNGACRLLVGLYALSSELVFGSL